MTSVVMLGSVFLPADVMVPVEEALARRGAAAITAVPAVPTGAPSADVVGAAYRRAVEDARPDVVVVHSNAGNFVPGLGDTLGSATVIFMDAVLPPLGGGRWPVVPPALRARLLPLAVDGSLPPWTAWWAEEDVRPLFPSSQWFARTTATAPSIPVAYLDEELTAPPGWAQRGSCAYLAFGDTYLPERHAAQAAGWPSATLDLGHLGMLQDPEQTARAILALAQPSDRG